MSILSKLKTLLVSRAYLKHEVDRVIYQIKADQLTQCAIHSTEKGVSDTKYCDSELIVSLTTYGNRLYDVYLTIESIMQGTLKPNRIVLWLQDDMKSIKFPIYLENQQARGLEIYYCKDLKSYKKLIPTLQKYPDATIITIDDDVLYREDIVEKLLNAYLNDPRYIYANRVHRIVLGQDGNPLSYNDWSWSKGTQIPSPLNFFTGVGGVLYPAHCFTKEILNENVFMQICPHADDVWFNAMGLLNGFVVSKVYTHDPDGYDYYFTDDAYDDSLSNVNVLNNGNDKQWRSVMNKYNLVSKLIE